MTLRYFKQGPNGNWRRSVKAIALDMGTMAGTLLYTNGKTSDTLEFSSTTVKANIERGDWREVERDEVRRWLGDTPTTPAEMVW